MELRSRIPAPWLAWLDQAGVTRLNLTPFPYSPWWGSGFLTEEPGLPGGRRDRPYESSAPLPLEVFRGDYQWLMGSGSLADPDPSLGARSGPRVDRIIAAAAQQGLEFPAAFLTFMRSTELQRRVRSPTDCYFTLPRRIVESPEGEGGYLVRCYSDSQDCFHWYVYLDKTGYHCVVGSEGFFGGYDEGPNDRGDWGADLPVWFMASSFEEYIYRTWIEGEIWLALAVENRALTREQQAYLDHYGV